MKAEPGPATLRHVGVVLTTGCNLRCAYCYQRREVERRMPWEVLRSAADLLLAGGAAEPVLTCYGGEPLLAFDMVRRVAAYLDERAPPGVFPRLAVVSNGTVIDEAALRFLAGRRVRLALSCDGVPAAQRLRGPATFERLDALLRCLESEWPGYFGDDVTVTMTLSSATLPHLAASVRYFLDRRVPSFTASPIDTTDPGWTDDSMAELDRQLTASSAACRRHFTDTGTVPFLPLRRRTRVRRWRRVGAAMCRIAEGHSACVDVDGEVVACGAFARSLVPPPIGPAADVFARVRLGHVKEHGVPLRLETRRRRLSVQPPFAGKERMRSPHARCAGCEAFAECRVCPAAIVHYAGKPDLAVVPPLPCAFTILARKHRRRFQAWLRHASQ
jgi:sulfatase maturation enzyme AslB (radical SAM superfamily)